MIRLNSTTGLLFYLSLGVATLAQAAVARPNTGSLDWNEVKRPVMEEAEATTLPPSLALVLEMMDKHCASKGKTSEKAGKPAPPQRITLADDKGFDVADFVDELRARQVTPHLAVLKHLTKTGKSRKTKIDSCTTRHPGYRVGQRIRKRIEEIFGWVRPSKFRGWVRVDAQFTLALDAFNLIRLPKRQEALP